MIRQIISKKQAGLRADASAADDLTARIIKMIPGEIVALYLTCNTAVSQFMGAAGKSTATDPFKIPPADPNWVYWLVFGLVLALTPFYLWKKMNITDYTQIVIMCISFILWTMTIQHPFDFLFGSASLQQLVSTIALAVFTFIIPVFYKGN